MQLPTPALVEVTKYRPVVNEHFLGFQSHTNSFLFLEIHWLVAIWRIWVFVNVNGVFSYISLQLQCLTVNDSMLNLGATYWVQQFPHLRHHLKVCFLFHK